MARVNVTKVFLPPIDEYKRYIDGIWARDQLTNQGPLLLELEEKLKLKLELNNLHFVTNGTLALQIAIKALELGEGEVITTPFSYVATVSSILWEGLTPVFVDIEPNTFCIDASKIEAAITSKTKAIMAVHVFGYPCDVEKIKAIADKHKLKVIYDGAHAFGVTYKGKSLLSYGDVSVCSFHATKLFHTIEGGAIITNDKLLSDKVELIKRFGHNGDDHYILGINAKASEFQAAMGLCNLKYIDSIIDKRKKAFGLYDQLIPKEFKRPILSDQTEYNYSYYPTVLKDGRALTDKMAEFSNEDIYPRRYFYPSLNTLPYLDSTQKCEVSEDIASRIICLPMYTDMATETIERICEVMRR